MAEFNPYKLEEEKWTPKNVYEILPPNSVSWSDYDFGQGTDNVDQEAANKSFIDGVIDFFSELFGTAGQILGGAVELGGKVLGGFVNGVINLVGGIANAIGSIFGGGSSESPNLPLFNPIKTNLEAAIKPHRDKINESWQKTEEILAQQEILVGQMEVSLEDMREASRKSKEASDRAGEAIGRAEAASAAAREARETLEEYNEALTKQIREEFNAAVGRAETAIEKAEAANSELATMNTKLGEITQQASDINDRLGEYNQRFTDGLDTANSAIEEAVSITAAVKALAEENQAKVASAISQAEKANADLALLSPKVADAVSKANKASSDVSSLTPKVDDAAAKAAKAATDVSALTPKVTAAQNKANKAASDLSTLTPKVTAAQTRADNAYKEAEKVRTEVAPKIEDAQTQGESALAVADQAIEWLKNPVEIGSSLIALDVETKEPYYLQWAGTPRTPSTSGVPFAKAVRSDSSTQVRYDAPSGMRVPVKVNPDITYKWSVWVYSNKIGTEIGFLTTSDSIGLCVEETTYKSDKSVNNSKWGIFVKDIPLGWSKQEGTIKFQQATDNVHLYAVEWNKTEVNNTSQWFAALDIVPDVPTQASVDKAQNDAIRANQDILRQQEEINEAQRVANKANNAFIDNQTKWNLASTNATQALADAAKAQKDVNAEQKKFNNFQTDFNKKQTKWNAAVDRSLETQKTVNDNFNEWTAGAATAIEANTTAIKALSKIDTGESLIAYLTPTDAEVKAGTAEYDVPVWTTATQKQLASSHSAVKSLPSPRKDVYGVEKGYGTHRANTVKVKVRPNTKYLWSFWSWGSGDLVIYMYGDGGGYPVRATRQIKVDQATQEEARTADGRRVYDSDRNGNRTSSVGTQWLLSGFDFGSHGTWKYNMYEVEFTSTTTEVWFDSFYWNWNNPSTGGQYLADMQFYPDVPTQADIDDAQNKAIQANRDLLVEQERINKEQKKLNKLSEDFEIEQKKINDEQKGINALNTKADNSLLQGLKALGKKALGASLVPYKTPSTKEVEDYAAGKLSYDPWADPEYFDAGYSIASNSTYGRYARANSGQGTNSYDSTLVSVDSSIEYRIKFDAYAAAAGSILVIHMEDQAGNSALQSSSVRDDGRMISSIYLVDYLALKKGWNSYSGKIKFKPSTTSARLSTFYWNHPNGVSTTQGFTNLEIVPDIPDANVVNLLQEEAILENTRIGKENNTAIKALESGLDAAIELGDANIQIEALEIELSKEAEKREALQRKVDDLQNEMIPRTIVSDDRVLYDDYVTLSGTKITAKTGWSGQMAVTYIERTGYGTSSTPYVYKTRVTRKSVPDGTTREWSFPSGIERVDYWVYQGRPRTILLANAGPYITGKTFSSGTWGVLATHKVGKTYGTGTIEWRANLQYADRGVTYRFKIEVNGKEVKNAYWKNIGPLTPLGSGKKTLRFEHEFSLPDDATVRVLGYAYNSNSQQARVSLLQGTLHYTQDTAREG